MYKIFFHLTGLALVEILFYFYYIGIMETTVFKNAIEDALDPIKKKDATPLHIINPYNSSEIIEFSDALVNYESEEFKDAVKKAEKKRKEDNNDLFIKAMNYWYGILAFSIVAFCIEMSIRYHYFKTKQKGINGVQKITSLSDISVEMTDTTYLRHRHASFDSTDITYDIENKKNDTNVHNTTEPTFINWNKIKKQICFTSCHYILLVTAIVGFEYLFFNHIILKYKIVSLEELEYIFYQKMEDIVHHVTDFDDA